MTDKPLDASTLLAQSGLMAFNKPAGIPTTPTPLGHLSLLDIVQREHRGAFPVHQIDRWTTGVVLVGKTPEIRGYMQRNWHQITKKWYLAIISAPEWDENLCSEPIDGRSACTSFKVLQRVNGYALVLCELVQNGRTHQIRRHLQFLGSPIVGDNKYGGEKHSARQGQLLHAWRVQVELPEWTDSRFRRSGEMVILQSPVPDDFRLVANWADVE